MPSIVTETSHLKPRLPSDAPALPENCGVYPPGPDRPMVLLLVAPPAAPRPPGQRPLPVPRRWPSRLPRDSHHPGLWPVPVATEASATGRRWPADLPGLTSKTGNLNAACAKTRGQCAPLLMATRHARSFKLVGIKCSAEKCGVGSLRCFGRWECP